MSDYNQRIVVSADTRSAQRSIEQLAKQLDRISAVDIGSKTGKALAEAIFPASGIKSVQKQLDGLLAKTDTVAKRMAIAISGVGLTAVGSKGLADLGNYLEQLSIQAGQTVDSLAQIPTAVKAITPGLRPAADSATVLAKAISTLEYRLNGLTSAGEQISNIFAAIGPEAGAAAGAVALLGASLQTVLNSELKDLGTQGSAALRQITDETQLLIKELASLSERLGPTLRQMERLRSTGQNRMEQSTVGSPEFRRGANTVAKADTAIAELAAAITDAVRAANGLRSVSTENRATNTYRTTQGRKNYQAEQQQKLNDELAEYERIAAEVVAQTKAWADNLTRVERSAKAGVLGSSSQLQTRLQQMREDRNSAQIARERSASLLGANYSLQQLPAGRELSPGGNTLTAQAQYRNQLNKQAISDASKTLQLQYNWNQALKQGVEIAADLRDIEASDLKIQSQKTAEAYEQLILKKRELAFEDKLAAIRQRDERKKQFGQRAESIALGVGFPLLFGAGPGAIGGSLAGSFVGSGFGGQILGGAIGQALDDFNTATIELGKSIASTTDIFDKLKEAALISSKALEKQLTTLQEGGFAATANAAAQQDLLRTIGPTAAGNLRDLGDAADAGSRQFAIAIARFRGTTGTGYGLLPKAQNFLAKGGEISNLQNVGTDIAAQLDAAGKSAAAKRLRDAINPFGSFGKSQDQVLKEYRAAVEAALKDIPVKLKIDPKQARDELINTLSKQLEAVDLARGLRDQVRSVARQQEDLDQQRADLVLQSERAIADLRLSIEQRVQDTRLSNLQRENDLLEVQARIREQSLANSNIGLRNGFSDSRVSQAAGAVADYLEAELRVANDSAKIKRDAALEVQRLDIETERFKLQVATQVARLNEDNAKRIAEINKGVRRQNADLDTRRFEIEKRIAIERLNAIDAEFRLLAGQAFGNPILQPYAQQGANYSRSEIDRLEKLQGPKALREVGGVGAGSASTAGVDAANARAKELLGNITAARQTLNDLISSGNWQQLQAQLTNILDKPLQDAIRDAQALWDELSGKQLGSGTNAAAERATALEKLQDQLRELQKLSKDPAVQRLIQGFIDQAPALDVTNTTLQVSVDELGRLNERYAELQDRLQELQSPTGELTETQKVLNKLTREGVDLESEYAKALKKRAEEIDKLKEKVDELERLQQLTNDLINQAGVAFADGFGDLAVGAINAAADATKNWAEEMRSLASDILKAIGNMLILNAIKAGISALAGSDGVGFFSILAGSFGKRAAGGPVAPGRSYLVGEQGPELLTTSLNGGGYVHNAAETRALLGDQRQGTSMGTAMNRYSPANSLNQNQDGTGSSDGTSGGANLNLQMSFQTTRFMDRDWVDKEQLQMAMYQATKQGGELGEARALRKLQHSASARRKLGMA